MQRLIPLNHIPSGVMPGWVKVFSVPQVFDTSEQIRTMWKLCHISISEQSLWVHLQTLTHAHLLVFVPLLFSLNSKTRAPLGKWLVGNNWLMRDVFYSGYYDVDSSGSPSRNCITMNHNILLCLMRPWQIAAWHQSFPSKNTALSGVREGVSDFQWIVPSCWWTSLLLN